MHTLYLYINICYYIYKILVYVCVYIKISICALHLILGQQMRLHFFEGGKQVGEATLCRMTSYLFPARHEIAPVPKCTKSLYS